MSDIICSKCGATAFTKCLHTRGIFPEHQLESAYNDFCGEIKVEEILNFRDQSVGKKATISISAYLRDGVTPEESILDIMRGILSCKNPLEVFCDHDWMLLPGFKSRSVDCDCSFEGTTKKYKREVIKVMKKFGVESKEDI